MKSSRIAAAILSASLVGLVGLASAVAETGDKSRSAAKSSEVDFSISCSPTAQKKFNQAVWILHSFWYEEAVKAFTAVTEVEPDCAMGYWGIAMSHWYPLWYPPNAASLKAGSDGGREGGWPRSRRPIAKAITSRQSRPSIGTTTRSITARAPSLTKKPWSRFTCATPMIGRRGCSMPLPWSRPLRRPTRPTPIRKRRRAILEAVRAELPNHPGVAHYLIHANDSAEMAEDGLTAALCYADIAPAVPHALHMPSHIFTRLGMWRQSVDANRAATAAGLAYVREELGPDAFNGEAVHSMDYMEYAYLQMGQDREAKRVVDELLTFRRANVPSLPMAYAIAAIPARYAVERRNWSEAAALTAPPMAFPWERFPWAEAMISFTRALGAAHTGDIAGAETEIAKLQSLKQKLDQAKDDYWAKQVEVQRLAASGILAHAKGDDKQAVELVRAAADLDATMDKHPATPAEVLPARELLADLCSSSMTRPRR